MVVRYVEKIVEASANMNTVSDAVKSPMFWSLLHLLYLILSSAHITCVSLNMVLEYELSLILGPVQNQILYSREPLCVGTLRNSVSK